MYGTTQPLLARVESETPPRSPSTSRRTVVVASVCLLGVAAVSMLSRNMGATTTQLQITPLEKPLFGDKSAADIEQLFAKFQSDYNRNYADEHELAFRFETFKQNLKLIDRLNNENPLAVFTITNSADYTDTERNQRRMKGKFANYTAMKQQLPESVLSTEQEALKKFETESSSDDEDTSIVSGTDMEKSQVSWISAKDCAACKQYPTFSKYTMSNLPDNFDWRDLGAVTSVKNQKYCGSCWTFSTAADVEGKHYLATGDLTSYSEQQLVACDSNSDVAAGCDGGYQTGAFQYLVKFGGMVTDSAYEYKGICAWDSCGSDIYYGTPTCDTSLLNTELKKGDVAHIGAWQMVSLGSAWEEKMALSLVKNGPIAISINANSMDFYDHGITGCSDDYCEAGKIDHHYTCDPTVLDHAVLIVGYGTEDGIPYWVVKNSWGSDWGEDGYWRTIRGVNHCGIANFGQTSVVKSTDR